MNRQSASYKVLFSNDTTNIETCVSPYHKKGEDFSEAMLRATVDETAGTGIDVHLLQPGMGTVPWWKSKVYPFEDHIRFMKDTYGMTPSQTGFSKYMASGGDMVAAFIDQCKKRNLAAFISNRMNDVHGHEFSILGKDDSIPAWNWHTFSKWLVEHRNLRISDDLSNWNGRVFDYFHPDVREHKLSLVQELIENYDIDGFELDFMRHFRLFDFVTTSFAERSKVMCDIVSRVRKLLDNKGGRYRYLCVRVPAFRELLNQLGINIPSIIEHGVDMINASVSYFTEQENELEFITRETAGRAKVYYEMCHSIYNGRNTRSRITYDSFTFMRATDEMFHSTADLAYRKGADGVSFFNFVYYREHGTDGRGPFNEPPFHIFKDIGNPKVMAEKACHYFLAPGFNCPYFIDTKKQMPRSISMDGSLEFTLTVGLPKLPSARIRLVAEHDISACTVKLKVNGKPVEATADVSEFYDKPYVNLIPAAIQCKGFTCDASLFSCGINKLTAEVSGVTQDIRFILLEVLV